MKHIISKHLMNKMHPIKVVLVGVGGNGSQMLSHLARINEALIAMGQLGLEVEAYDFDVVEQHNVGRQLFSNIDVGENKAIIAIERINQYYGLNWRGFDEAYKGEENNMMVDIIITCVDTVEARIDVSQGNYRYWLDMGNSVDRGQVILGGSGLKTVIDLHPNIEDEEELDEPSCSMVASLRKQDLMVNTIITGYASHLLWSLLKNYYIENQGCYINLTTLKNTPIKVRENALQG